MTTKVDAREAGALTVASWNVNSIRARLDHVLTWLVDHEPDVLCLQETKVEDNLFPRVPFLELGYTVTLHGGRALAGVATLSKRAPTEIQVGFRDGEDDRAPRVLETVVDGLRIFNLYAPNGTGVGSDAFGYKLQWYARLRSQLDRECSPEQAVLVIGDFNVAPDARDVWDPEYFQGRLQFTPEEHTALQQLRGFGLDECYRHLHPEPGQVQLVRLPHQRLRQERRHAHRPRPRHPDAPASLPHRALRRHPKALAHPQRPHPLGRLLRSVTDAARIDRRAPRAPTPKEEVARRDRLVRAPATRWRRRLMPPGVGADTDEPHGLARVECRRGAAPV